jgi:hypothetical protein
MQLLHKSRLYFQDRVMPKSCCQTGSDCCPSRPTTKRAGAARFVHHRNLDGQIMIALGVSWVIGSRVTFFGWLSLT